MRVIKIGTRQSPLAIAQATLVRDALALAGETAELVPISTRGDEVLDRALGEVGGQGLFTTEIEHALIAGTIDCAVHSLKDLPGDLAEGLTVGAYSTREDPRDVLIANPARPLAALDPNPVIGTSSPRRQAFLHMMRPDARVTAVRGNLATRLDKLEREGWQGLILAAAGVIRVGWRDRVSEYLDPWMMVPAPGQGTLAVEIREGDARMQRALLSIHDVRSATVARAERAVLATLGGGCQIPLGAYAEWTGGGDLRLVAKIATPDGEEALVETLSGPSRDPEGLGRSVAERLLERGARALIAGARNGAGSHERMR